LLGSPTASRRLAAVVWAILLLAGCEATTRSYEAKPTLDGRPEPGSLPPAARIVDTPAAPASAAEPKPPPPAAEPPSRPDPPAPRYAAKQAVYDPQGPGFPLLQAPAAVLRDLPTDSHGDTDWVQALALGLIAPRADIGGRASMQVFDQDIIMKSTREMPWVRFPHRQHTEWLACSNCHPRPFSERAGSTDITMDSIMRGQHCGMCHDRVAFSILLCERCHSELHPGSPTRWW
jgi:c(7)-type cytochrome triheme protein